MWFDSSSIANLAKNALKEAQKHIDNVLDIKDDDVADSAFEETKMVKSKTMPVIQEQDVNNKKKDEWGSFNGSFFETNKNSSRTITNPPPTRKSETSSESLEVISKTPSSLASPDIHESSSQSTLQGSEDSVEVINKTASNLDSQPDLLSPSNFETDDSSALLTPDEVPSLPITIAPTRSINELDTSTTIISSSTLTNSESESFYDPSKDDVLDQTLKAATMNIMEKSMESFEIQTQVSDSTHSFEEINPSKLKTIPSNEAGKTEKKSSSGHTSSGDELETATSSDIEIISSPNGDSSSTASCTKALSPQKSSNLNTFPYQNSDTYLLNLQLDRSKGHSRELSEISVLSLTSDECGSPTEIEKLLKRISEVSENLEQRELQLVQIGRSNAELTDVNLRLTQELEGIKRGRNSLDMTNVQEEYTQRLSALEKKFQQSIRENSMLKKQLETMKTEMVSAHEYDKMSTEKDAMIETLKSEGEKLSKQILQHSTAIKKLKAKIKDNDELIKRNESQISELSEENQRLKKNLTAKDEIEKSQSEGINKLTTDKRKFEKESQQLKSQNEDLQQKLLALQTSHDVLKKELSDKSVEMGRNLEDEKEKALADSKQLKKELSELREINRSNESAATMREQKLRQENHDLKKKLEMTEFRIEDQKQEVALASIPLIKQLESLQSTLNLRTAQWENQERILLAKLDDAQNKLTSQTDVEKQAKEQVTHLTIKISNLEEKLSSTSLKLEQIIGQLQQKEIEFNLHENDYKLRVEQLSAELSNKSNEAEKFKTLLSQSEEKMRLERNEFEDEKRKLLFIQQQSHGRAERQDSHENELGNESPILSLGSVESLHSHPWNIDEQDIGANSAYGSHYGGIVNSSASLMEGLQSVLKQRDGEVQQLQWEIHRLQTERNFLSNEMSNLTAELEKASEQIKDTTEKQTKQVEIQIQYDALLEMYGQKAEEYEELKLDLVDLKSISQMYKIQIDELTQKLNDIGKQPNI